MLRDIGFWNTKGEYIEDYQEVGDKEMAFSINDINKLEQENAELKEENVKLLFDKGTLVGFCNKLTQIIDEKKENENKLLQTMQEIKEIAEENKDTAQYGGICKSILDLITKAEEE